MERNRAIQLIKAVLHKVEYPSDKPHLRDHVKCVMAKPMNYEVADLDVLCIWIWGQMMKKAESGDGKSGSARDLHSQKGDELKETVWVRVLGAKKKECDDRQWISLEVRCTILFNICDLSKIKYFSFTAPLQSTNLIQ